MPDTARLTTALAGRYRIEREIGAGGMATVYLARDIKHDRDVALKVLRPELGAVLGSERFLSEIRISARLDHPHILTLIDSGESDTFLWYVLPYVRGESLRDRLNREKQLSLEEALGITRQVASALDLRSSAGRRASRYQAREHERRWPSGAGARHRRTLRRLHDSRIQLPARAVTRPRLELPWAE